MIQKASVSVAKINPPIGGNVEEVVYFDQKTITLKKYLQSL